MDTEEKDDLDPRLEMRLGEELRHQLDRQIGRAARHFLKRRAAEHDGPPLGRKRRVRLLAGLMAVAAAFCAVFLARERIRPGKRPDGPFRETVVALPLDAAGQSPLEEGSVDDEPANAAGPDIERQVEHDGERGPSPSSDRESPGDGGRTSAAEPLILGRTLKTRTRDEGTLLVGQTAVRKIRRQWLERVEWFDPQNGARVERIVPREEILFVPLPIN